MIEENADARRRAQLQAAKLKAIVGERYGLTADSPLLAEAESLAIPEGSGLVLARDPSGDASAGASVEPQAHFVTATDAGLGGMLLLADRAGAGSMVVYGDVPLGSLTRQSRVFDFDIEVLNLEGRNPVPASAAAPATEPVAPDEVVMALEGTADDDVRTVVEHGEAVAEVAGLEIARASMDKGELVVRVGVGWADQELAAMIEPGLASVDRIRAAAALVRQHRRPDAPPHPLQRVAAERWLLSRLMDDPQRWGFAELAPVSMLEPRVGLRLNAPAAAAGTRTDGTEVLVVASVGVNPELVVMAGDLHQQRYPQAELVLAMPEADNHKAIGRQAARLRANPTFLATPAITKPWPN